MYNYIELEDILTPFGYFPNRLMIDKKPLSTYLKEWATDKRDAKFLNKIRDWSCAWNKDIDAKDEIELVWMLLEKNSAVVPLLLDCNDPERPDLSEKVIVVEVAKTNDFVYWERIGYCINFNNYYHQGENEIRWIKEPDWKFSRTEYENILHIFWEAQTLKELRSIATKKIRNVFECAEFLAGLTRNGRKVLEEHIATCGEIQLHLLASDLITKPLIALSKRYPEGNRATEIYCKAIERMKKYGSVEVKNVVDVTVWEGLQGAIDSKSTVYRFMTKLMEGRSEKYKRLCKKWLLILLICVCVGFFFKRTCPIGRTDFRSFEHFEQMGGGCCWYEIPDGVQDIQFYLTDTVFFSHSIYAFTIEDEAEYDAFMEYIRAESCYESAVEYPGWMWNVDGIAKYSEDELNEMSYLQQNHSSMDYKEVLERTSRFRFGFASAYGADVEDFIDIQYTLDEFPIGLPFEEVIPDDIMDYTILRYHPMGTGSVEDGILVNQETHRFVIYYAGQIR